MSTHKIAECIDLHGKLELIHEYWAPKIVGELNAQLVKLAKFRGEFVWHKHDAEDELFLVLKGHLTIRLEDRDIHLREGQFTIIPKGTRHLPVADQEVHVLLLEPASTVNTGDVRNDRTVASEWI